MLFLCSALAEGREVPGERARGPEAVAASAASSNTAPNNIKYHYYYYYYYYYNY